MELDNYDEPNILFLRGCFLKNCSSIEDMFDERIMKESFLDGKTMPLEEIVYDKIPEKFVSLETWVKKTNLKCWNCDCNFYTIPIFVPEYMKDPDVPDRKHGDIGVHGNFCSWNCASFYISLMFRDVKWEKDSMLKILYTIFTGDTIHTIPHAPSKTKMVQFGGSMTRTEYKNNLTEMNSIYEESLKHGKMNNFLVS